MKQAVAILMCAAVLAGAVAYVTQAAPNKPAVLPVYEFVGYSSDQDLTAGGVGYPTLYQKCQDVFGEAARMASTTEYIESPDAFVPTVNAWLRPEVSNTTSGLLNCEGWQGGTSGLTVVENVGAIKTAGCGLLNVVACSAPVQ